LFSKYYYDQLVMVIFIMHKYFTTNFTIMRRTRELYMTGLQIELRKIFFVHQNREEEMFFKEYEWVSGF
jgi:hypothetical protein